MILAIKILFKMKPSRSWVFSSHQMSPCIYNWKGNVLTIHVKLSLCIFHEQLKSCHFVLFHNWICISGIFLNCLSFWLTKEWASSVFSNVLASQWYYLWHRMHILPREPQTVRSCPKWAGGQTSMQSDTFFES